MCRKIKQNKTKKTKETSKASHCSSTISIAYAMTRYIPYLPALIFKTKTRHGTDTGISSPSGSTFKYDFIQTTTSQVYLPCGSGT